MVLFILDLNLADADAKAQWIAARKLLAYYCEVSLNVSRDYLKCIKIRGCEDD